MFVEFGFEPFALYQVMPFKKIETANFELPQVDYDKALRSEFVFGVTQPEGIVLPILRSFGAQEYRAVLLQRGESNPTSSNIIEFNERDRVLTTYLSLAARSIKSTEDIFNLEEIVSKYIQKWNTDTDTVMDEDYCLMISSISNGKEVLVLKE